MFKHIYALDLAAALEFEWDYQNADPDDLYETLEICGYTWVGGGWYTGETAERMKMEEWRRNQDLERLAAWSTGQPIRLPVQSRTADPGAREE
jgi:hypothetical protein